jgi:hypothetical protein
LKVKNNLNISDELNEQQQQRNFHKHPWKNKDFCEKYKLELNNQLKLNRYYLEENSCYEVKCKSTSDYLDNIKNSMLKSARLAEKGFYTKYSFKEKKLSWTPELIEIYNKQRLWHHIHKESSSLIAKDNWSY